MELVLAILTRAHIVCDNISREWLATDVLAPPTTTFFLRETKLIKFSLV